MIVSINQPCYLPWLGYFDRIVKSDLHVVLDHVQFEKNSVTNRNKIRTAEGWQWLTVPVRTKGRFGDLAVNLIEVEDNRRWADKHWKSLEQHYRRAPYFPEHAEFFREVYTRPWRRLFELISETNRYIFGALGMAPVIRFSSEFGLQSRKEELVLDLCRAVGATHYISGPFGREYLSLPAFESAGIGVTFHDYQHPTYDQAYPGFQPHLSVVDLLFNHGLRSLSILSNTQRGID
jgi:WbqC-like protein family